MPGSPDNERAEQTRQKWFRLRRRAAEAARSVAATEDRVAQTLERLAENRPDADAERLRAKAKEARRCAARERDLGAQYEASSRDGEGRGDQQERT